MKYTVKASYVDVVGRLWMGGKASLRINLSGHDLENMRDDDGQITRETVEQWLSTHSGDFQHTIDFSASIEDGDKSLDFPFATEEGEMDYLDTFPVEE